MPDLWTVQCLLYPKARGSGLPTRPAKSGTTVPSPPRGAGTLQVSWWATGSPIGCVNILWASFCDFPIVSPLVAVSDGTNCRHSILSPVLNGQEQLVACGEFGAPWSAFLPSFFTGVDQDGEHFLKDFFFHAEEFFEICVVFGKNAVPAFVHGNVHVEN